MIGAQTAPTECQARKGRHEDPVNPTVVPPAMQSRGTRTLETRPWQPLAPSRLVARLEADAFVFKALIHCPHTRSTPRAQKRGPRAIPNDARVGQNSKNKNDSKRHVRLGCFMCFIYLCILLRSVPKAQHALYPQCIASMDAQTGKWKITCAGNVR